MWCHSRECGVTVGNVVLQWGLQWDYSGYSGITVVTVGNTGLYSGYSGEYGSVQWLQWRYSGNTVVTVAVQWDTVVLQWEYGPGRCTRVPHMVRTVSLPITPGTPPPHPTTPCTPPPHTAVTNCLAQPPVMSKLAKTVPNGCFNNPLSAYKRGSDTC